MKPERNVWVGSGIIKDEIDFGEVSVNDNERHSIWDDDNMNDNTPVPKYTMLSTIISFTGFEFVSHGSHGFITQEQTILKPRLEALGYTDIHFFEGETDSFGPLTRRCRAVNPFGDTVWFMYG